MNRFLSLCLVGTLVSILSVTPALAAPPKSLGKFGYWTAYQLMEGANPVCYMSITAKPPVPKGSKLKRGDVVLMITHRPAESSTDVVSYAAGTKFKPASEVTMQIGGKTFNLFTQADTAWSRDSATDKALAAALRTGASVTVLGTTASGGPIADTVSLKGSAEAYYAIGKACGLPVEKPKAEKKESKDSKAKSQQKRQR